MMNDANLPREYVLESWMSYREAGDPYLPTAVFLHGNPTSSFIWRDIIPSVARVAHCIAPDLIGFGQSGKPDIEYRFADHVHYLNAFVDGLGIDSAYLVAQDWGTALAFHLAAKRPRFVRGMVFMEFIRPMASWDEFHRVDAARETFKKFRTPGIGEHLILRENAFVERVLPNSTKRKLTEAEMAVYRAPFPTPASRLPTWRFPNELPIEGYPPDVTQMLVDAHRALAESTYPKILLVGDPGALVSPEFAHEFASGLINCTVENLGVGAHYLQEDHPAAIADAVCRLVQAIE